MSATDNATSHQTYFADPVLNALTHEVITTFGELPEIVPANEGDFFGSLCESIISQQLSTKVADVITARVKTVVGGSWIPEAVLQTDYELLKGAGLSGSKVNYIQNVATAWSTGSVDPQHLTSAEPEEVITQLVQIKGVGRWTAEMFLIFTLGKTDVFSAGDYGLRKAISQAYDLDLHAKPQEFLSLAQHWSPQRTYASRILWKSLELQHEKPNK